MGEGAFLFGEFRMVPSDRRLYRGGASVPLPPKAFDACCLLVENHGSLVSRRHLLDVLWPGVHVAEANLTNIIGQLRRALGRGAIETVSKYGYRFTPVVTGEPGVKQATYASFVRGKELLVERKPGSMQEARDLFLLCVATDPQFAAAWAWLGRASRLLAKFEGGPAVGTHVAEAAYRRALAVDPDLSCAHQFYTQLETDTGRAREALVRLLERQGRCGTDPGTLAGLVQVLRFCGLVDESIEAHERAVALDPTTKTSVTHTYFLQGDYVRVLQTYPGSGYYLDAAAWAGLGEGERAAGMLRPRLERPALGPLMRGLMGSLLAVLEGRRDEALATMETVEVVDEPEMLFYLARHCALLGDGPSTLRMLRRARIAGFASHVTLETDPVFAPVRGEAGFAQELGLARQVAAEARKLLPGGFLRGSADVGERCGNASASTVML